MRVAIIGSGIAGLAAARALAPAHEVVMFEAATRPGGHVYTVDAHGHAIDMGFIVCNPERYPLFFGMLAELGVETRPTTMAFSVVHGEREWGSESLSAVFAERRRLVDPRHWRFLGEVVRFLSRARLALEVGVADEVTLDDFIADSGLSRELREGFLVPLAAALWSLAPDHCGEFPAVTFLRFLEQHGMLSALQPLRWHTVVGGSRAYVDALLARLRGGGRFTLHLGAPVERVVRDDAGVTVAVRGAEMRVDRVIVATHANTALALLDAPTDDERAVLGAFRYSANRTVLHTDRAFLPSRAAAHAAWNYVADRDTSRVAVTYSMTRLQGLPDAPYLVTLNPRSEPRGILHDVTFEHPQFDRAALAAQRRLPALQGVRRTYYAGAHTRFGFHEDGMRSGQAAAARTIADSVGVPRGDA